MPFALFYTLVNDKSFLYNFIFNFNVMFTLLFGLICIWIWDKAPNKFIATISIIEIVLLAEALHVDYGGWGVLFVFICYLCKGNKFLLLCTFFSMFVAKCIPSLIKTHFNYLNYILMIFEFLAIVPIMFYNGKQGRKIRNFMYAFYPVHLTAIYLIQTFLIK